MGKALVLYDVDFSANKVAKVTFSGGSVPCTGISLSQNSISFTALSATVELAATLTPNNTTDELSWQSSDENVATVVDGVVTCVGVGTAVITASCGLQSATCSVSSTVTVNANTAYYAENGQGFYYDNKNYAMKRSQAYSRLYYNGTDILGGYDGFYGDQTGYAIPIPKGTNLITVTVPDGFGSRPCKICAVDTTTRAGTSSALACATVLEWSSGNPDANKQRSISLDNIDANGFMFEVQCATSDDASTITGDVLVTFSKVVTE